MGLPLPDILEAEMADNDIVAVPVDQAEKDRALAQAIEEAIRAGKIKVQSGDTEHISSWGTILD